MSWFRAFRTVRDNAEEQEIIFNQDGILLTGAEPEYVSYINLTGTLLIFKDVNGVINIEWKPSLISDPSNNNDRYWSLVGAIVQWTYKLMPSPNIKTLKLNMNKIKSFRSSASKHELQFLNETDDALLTIQFDEGDSVNLISVLVSLYQVALSTMDEYHYIILDSIKNLEENSSPLTTQLRNLDIKEEESTSISFSTCFNSRLHENSTTALLPTTSTTKVLSSVITSDEQVDSQNTIGSFSHKNYQTVTSCPQPSYGKCDPIDYPLTKIKWDKLKNSEGQIKDVDSVMVAISQGGISPQIRKEVWKYLLDFYQWDDTDDQRQKLVQQKKEQYCKLKLQWSTKTDEDEDVHFKRIKRLVRVDAIRTDRHLEYYAEDDNPNTNTMFNILMTYAMYNYDLGYVQGMSDFLSPILYLLDDEVEAFWCFVGFLNRLGSHFDLVQNGIRNQLHQLRTILDFIDPDFVNYLDTQGCGDMLFCFQWMFLKLKREINMNDVMRLWELLLTNLPCSNFFVLICVAILDEEKSAIINNKCDFAEITKFINGMAGKLDVIKIIHNAEELYHHLATSQHLIDPVRLILGLPALNK